MKTLRKVIFSAVVVGLVYDILLPYFFLGHLEFLFLFWPLILPLCNFLIPCKFAMNITTGKRTSPFSQFSCFSLGIYCLVSWLKAVQGSVRLMVRAVVPARGRINSFVALSLMASSFPLWCQALDPRLPSVLL